MPQAPSELQAMFDDDTSAFVAISEHFTIGRDGVIRPKDKQRKPTKLEGCAIDYLCLEWDYGYCEA